MHFYSMGGGGGTGHNKAAKGGRVSSAGVVGQGFKGAAAPFYLHILNNSRL